MILLLHMGLRKRNHLFVCVCVCVWVFPPPQSTRLSWSIAPTAAVLPWLARYLRWSIGQERPMVFKVLDLSILVEGMMHDPVESSLEDGRLGLELVGGQ